MWPDHPLAEQQTIKWSDLASHALILPVRGTGNRLMTDEAMARTGLPIRWTFEVAGTSFALDLASGSVGIAPVPQSALSQHPARIVIARPSGGLDPGDRGECSFGFACMSQGNGKAHAGLGFGTFHPWRERA